LVEALGPDVPTIVVRYPDAPLDYEAHQQIAASSLPQDRPYILLGESFSGPIAIALAAQHPAGLLGCILCASFVKAPRHILRLALPFVGLMPPATCSVRLGGLLCDRTLCYACSPSNAARRSKERLTRDPCGAPQGDRACGCQRTIALDRPTHSLHARHGRPPRSTQGRRVLFPTCASWLRSRH
jgi:pimeloyl-ACP methyl ester carboxylesterase